MQGSASDMPPPYYPSSDPNSATTHVQQPMQYGHQAYSNQHQLTQSSVVVVQQPPRLVQQMTSPPNDYLGWSIVGCLFCFWPIGLCAIVASMNARSAIDSCDMEGAKTNSNAALGLNITNTVLTIILIVVIVVIASS